MDWQLEPGKRYRLWYRDKTPMPDIVVFERVALNLQRPQIPRLSTRPPLPIKEVWLCFRYEKSGFEMVLGLDDLTGCGLELLD